MAEVMVVVMGFQLGYRTVAMKVSWLVAQLVAGKVVRLVA